MTLNIRDAIFSDADTIASFNSRMCEETEGRSLDPAIIGPGVAALLADSGKGRYWIAEMDNRVVGQIMVTWEWSDWRNGRLWWIQSVYVVPECRRHGVFSALYKHVEQLAKIDTNSCGLRLYYERDNERARQTYLALGMVDPGYRMMESLFGTNKTGDT